jgi:hypothetical protein
MKIRQPDLATLTAFVQPLDTPANRAYYASRQFSNADRCKDVDKRYRWDLLYASRCKIGDGVGSQGDVNLYAYMDDSHIDTALRSIVPAL